MAWLYKRLFVIDFHSDRQNLVLDKLVGCPFFKYQTRTSTGDPRSELTLQQESSPDIIKMRRMWNFIAWPHRDLFHLQNCSTVYIEYSLAHFTTFPHYKRGAAVAQSVERATPGKEILGSIPIGWVGVGIKWPTETEAMVSQLRLMCGST